MRSSRLWMLVGLVATVAVGLTASSHGILPDWIFPSASQAKAVSAYTDLVFLPDTLHAVIRVVDPATDEELEPIAVPGELRSITIDRDRGIIYAPLDAQDVDVPGRIMALDVSNLTFDSEANALGSVGGASVAEARSGTVEIDDPAAVLAIPGLDFAVVTDRADRTVALLDVDDRRLLRRIQLNATPAGVAIDPTGSYAYVALPETNSVAAIDLNSGMVAATAGTGHGPRQVYLEGSRLFVANGLEGSITVIDTKSLEVLATIAVGGNPYAFVGDERGGVYVASFGADSVSRIDTATLNVTWTISTGYNPAQLALSPDLSRLYVLGFYSGSITIVDLVGHAVVDVLNWKRGEL